MDIRALETPLPQNQPPPEDKDPAPSWLPRGMRWRDRFHVTPINARRWSNFKANRRGYWSLIVFLSLFGLSLFAKFIANDRPIIMSYKGEILWPVFVDYPESKFGGFLAVTDYKDAVILEEMEKNGWAIWPPISYSYHSINRDYPRIKNASGQCLGFPGPPPWSTSAVFCDTPADHMAR